MGRKRKSRSNVEGVIVVDKPTGITSYDVIRDLKPKLGTGKLGHTGTLDPMATGVLVVCAGWATRLIPFLSTGVKRYTGSIRFGVTTDTDDADGEVVMQRPLAGVTDAAIAAELKQFTGTLSQVPPAYSAAKVDGKRAYAAAREGAPVALAPREVTVSDFSLGPLEGDLATFEVEVSGGTYIRSLARDLGAALGCGAHLASLRRTENSGFGEAEAMALAEVEDASALRSLEDALDFMPEVRFEAPEAARMRHGQTIPVATAPPVETLVRVHDADTGALIAVGRVDEGYESPVIRPVRVRPS